MAWLLAAGGSNDRFRNKSEKKPRSKGSGRKPKVSDAEVLRRLKNLNRDTGPEHNAEKP